MAGQDDGDGDMSVPDACGCQQLVARPPDELVAAGSASAVDVLSDDVLEQLCMCLPGRELLRFSASSRQLNGLASASSVIWGHLSRALLGWPLCQLHVALARRRGREVDAAFWSSLFRRGLELRCARWSSDLRAAFLQSLGSEGAEERFMDAAIGSGHCTVAVGQRLVVKLGGLRPQCRLEHIHAAAFDLADFTIREVALTPDSAKPERRLRHAACEIRPSLTNGRPAVLVLGGCHDRTKQPCAGGLQLLQILELFEDGSSACSGRWHTVQAEGAAPRYIWHHICSSFASGRRVVVFGGDFSKDDPEFEHISDRALPATFVYILDVDRRTWEHVGTSGPAPTWRSLHAGCTYLDPSSHSERLVILGGCAAHTRPFGSSDALEEMQGHALDLRSFEWLPQPSQAPPRPAARLRLAAERVGEWLVLYGGHGRGDELGERSQLHKLNLRTLCWGTLQVHGREGRFASVAGATLTAGLCLGGVELSVFGIAPVPKLDVLILCHDELSSEEAQAEEEADGRAGEVALPGGLDSSEDESSENEAQMAVAEFQGASGAFHRVQVSRTVLLQLLAQRHILTPAAGAGASSGDSSSDASGNDHAGSSEPAVAGQSEGLDRMEE
mmetsp:Transcript_107658/g.347472  ORF Transcript_107658/g.347472 Transcript_107658/m.347472 type:complete len:614 (-) Transcript_107658:300-2141(-)